MGDMTFSEALTHLKGGGSVSRHGWNGPNQSLKIQQVHAESFMTLPYIYITTVQDRRVPWLASQTDLLEEDWYAV